MNTFRKIIRAFQVSVPLVDRILELVALVLLIAMLSFTAYLYQQAPDQIVIKYSSNGEPVDWAEKAMFWYMSIFFIVMMLCSAASAYDVNMRFTNLPFRLKEPVKAVQLRLIGRMGRCVTICMGLMWLSYLLHISASFMDIPTVASLFSKATLFLMLAVLVYYSVKSWRVGRGY